MSNKLPLAIVTFFSLALGYTFYSLDTYTVYSPPPQDSGVSASIAAPPVGDRKFDSREKAKKLRGLLAEVPSAKPNHAQPATVAECLEDWLELPTDPLALQEHTHSSQLARNEGCKEWMTQNLPQCKAAVQGAEGSDPREIFLCRANIINAAYRGPAKDLETSVLMNIAYALGDSSERAEQARLLEVGKELSIRKEGEVFGYQIVLSTLEKLALQFHEGIDAEVYAGVRDKLVLLTESLGKPEEALAIKLGSYFGLVSAELKDLHQAREDIETFQQRFPENGKAYYMGAWYHYLQGDRQSAVSLLQKAYELCPTCPDIRESHEVYVKEKSLRFILQGNQLDFSEI